MLKLPKKKDQLTNVLILVFVFFLGYLTSNVEQKHWYNIEINALKTQLEKVHCGEITIPKWRKQRDKIKKKSYASFNPL